MDKAEILRIAFPNDQRIVYGIVTRATGAGKAVRIFAAQLDDSGAPVIRDETPVVARACGLRMSRRGEILVRGVNFCPIGHVAESVAGALGFKILRSVRL